jgi:hypothetical protein
MLKQSKEPDDDGKGEATRHPNDRKRGRSSRLVAALVAVPAVLVVALAGALALPSPSWGWNIGTPTASAACEGSMAVITGHFPNNESSADKAMDVTMSYGGQTDSKTVQPSSTGDFRIDTGQPSLSAGDVTFTATWTNGQPGSETRTAHFDAVAPCGPPDDTDKKIAFCHATGSATNPYVFIETSVNAFFQAGHIDHANDIWPAFSYTKNGQTYNVPAQGDQSLLAKGCEVPTTQQVTPAAPTATSPDCDHPNSTVTAGNQPGVIWNPTLPITLAPGQSQTVTASPATGYAFPQNAQTSWTFTNDFDVMGCETPPPGTGDYNGTTSGTCKTGTGTGMVEQGYDSNVKFTLKVGRGTGKWAIAHFTVRPGQSATRSLPGHPGDKVLLFAKGKLISASTLKKDCGTPPPPPPTCHSGCNPPPNNPPTTPAANCTSASCVPTATAETGLGDMIGSSSQPHRGAGWMESLMLFMASALMLFGLWRLPTLRKAVLHR